MRNVGRIHSLALETPPYRVRETPPEEFDDEILTGVKSYGERSDYDWASQLRAMLATDISGDFDGSMKRAAAAVKADVLIVAATPDHPVNLTSARAFAELLNARTLILESDCGHRAPGDESAGLAAPVNAFLE